MADQVQEVKSKINIVDIIGEYVNLRKAGRNFSGLCPFHNEKSPSFMVNQELQMFKCFGCGESGDVFTFLQKHEGLEFYEALQILAKKAGVELKTVNLEENSHKNELKRANYEAARFYHYILTKHPKGEKAREYLFKERGLTLETVEEFRIGYAPEESSALSSYLNNKKGIPDKIIEESGVAYKGRYGMVDRFRGRIIFPIADHRGSVIALAGRILPELSGKGLAKYINSPETPLYHKSNSLYGIDRAKQYIKKAESAVLTEGELDMLSSWQHGIRNVVAVKGTALTQEQVFLLSRFTKSITLALDSDFAGDNAALRGITLAQNQDLEVKVASMGKYKDPDEFVRDDEDGYRESIANAENIWDFLIDMASDRFDLSSGTGKSRAAKFYLPFLEKLTDDVLRTHYLSEFSRKISINKSVLQNQIRSQRNTETITKKETVTIKKTRRQMLEESAVRLGLTLDPTKLNEVVNKELLSYSSLRRIAQLASKQPKFELQSFINEVPEEEKTVLSDLLLTEFNAQEDADDFDDILLALESLHLKDQIAVVTQKIEKYEREKNSEKLRSAEKKFNKLNQQLMRLEESKNSSII